MKTVGASEARTHLSYLLDEVEQGRWVEITRNGQRVAVMSPVSAGPQIDRRQAVEEIRALRRRVTTGGLPVHVLIEEGRRFRLSLILTGRPP